ncbi:PWWP domain-containing protein 2A [Syngnathus acus]|uniref:PWWP domain-containing protein 2A n=1 Tax=Syngnathus acus TaxID=161584 RepID=UPI001885B597|nr:PWWP domain-containing protein 2A [Syngnathus acus]
MAAVATEPGAAAIRTAATTDDGSLEPSLSGQGGILDSQEPKGAPEPEPAVAPELAAELFSARLGDGGDGEERRHVRLEPELDPAAGKVQGEVAAGDALVHNRSASFSLGEASWSDSAQAAYCSILAQPKPSSSAVFLHSFPAPRHPPGAEAGLSLAEPAEPTTNAADQDRGYPASVQPEQKPVASQDAGLVGTADANPDSEGRGPCCVDLTPDVKLSEVSVGAETMSCATRHGGCVQDLSLSLGSEVRVSLDHVIDDALVVSFRVGEKLFSGVLMDISKRFGPYGIPITPFPRREDQSRPQRDAIPAEAPVSPKQEVATDDDATPCPWSSKPPPLFQEGAPYPPPLFIRDTYNQALPQPLPRKIKRPKRRYRCEEPTSIMNAIKLRPRQVLCDKCKGVVVAAGRRPGTVDLRGEEVSRRRKAAEGPVSAEVKRLRSDDKGSRSDRRAPSGIRVSASASSPRVLRAVSSSSSMRLKLNSKKVLPKGNPADRSKTRQVLKKLARNSQPSPPPLPLGENQDREAGGGGGKALTRAAALQNHNQNQKVHFTRRLQHLSTTLVGPASHTALPPRMRLKPQRYRTDDPQATPSSSSFSSSSSSSPPKHASSATSSPKLPAHEPAPPSPRLAPSPTPPASIYAATEAKEAPPPPPSHPPHHSVSETVDPVSLVPPCPASAEALVGDEEGGELKRHRKSSTSSSSSSSSTTTTTSSSVFSKSVSKCLLPDGRTVCVGDIVWAKIYGFPWWPARVLGITVARRANAVLAARQEARVAWFGSPTTSFLPLSQLSPFLESFQSRFDRKRKGPYRRAISEAASAAKQLTPEVRALLTQFET